MHQFIKVWLILLSQLAISSQSPVDLDVVRDNNKESTWLGTPNLDIVLQSDRFIMVVLAEKIHEANLPMQLRPAARDIFELAQTHLKKCETEYVSLNLKLWTYKICAAEVLKESLVLVDALTKHNRKNQIEHQSFDRERESLI